MVKVTNNGLYVKIDMTDFVSLDQVDYSIIYLMKDQSWGVCLEKNNLWVEVHTPMGVYQLDMSGQKGLPAKVGVQTPSDNADLAGKLAALKNL